MANPHAEIREGRENGQALSMKKALQETPRWGRTAFMNSHFGLETQGE